MAKVIDSFTVAESVSDTLQMNGGVRVQPYTDVEREGEDAVFTVLVPGPNGEPKFFEVRVKFLQDG